MIPGIVAGKPIASAPPTPDTVSFIAASGTHYVSGATSIGSPQLPSDIHDGDGLFAVVFARSALTPPAGWTLVVSKTNTGSVTQTLYVYRKDTVVAANSSQAFTWSQSASGRMGLGYLQCRSSSGTVTVAQSDTAETDYTVSTAYPHNVTVPTLSADGDGELFLIAFAAELGSMSADTWTAPTGAAIRSSNPQVENRLGFATQARNSGQSNAFPGQFSSSSASANYYSSSVVRLAP